ncbi:glycosyltransferase family 2 protein [uncultured Duncaniella sp.]|uniref:glycosyltransferase family 2 protein n=1 Tax=uncultured Duncaniella sp. TaxID=2768039 RepID=UPI002675E778|nr:glycosyltransferase family 2 protein [uncultured Duncaniella sp.]
MTIITAIIPIFNSEKYLHKCLDSIRNQTFKDFEVILIDDGSSDGSLAICEKYTALDSRFRTIHINNNGVSHARNIGLDNVNGKVVTFIDSDDYVEPQLFETYITTFETNQDIDAVKVGYFHDFNLSPKIVTCTKDNIFEDKSDLFKYLEEIQYYSFVWNVCLKADKLNGLRFNEEINWLEDHIFCYQYYLSCYKVAVLSSPLYHYIVNSDTETLSNVKNPDIIAKAMTLEYELKKLLNAGKYKEIEKQIVLNYCHNVHRMVDVLYRWGSDAKSRKKLSKIHLLENQLIYKEEQIFFNTRLPFFFRDMILKVLYFIRRKKQ